MLAVFGLGTRPRKVWVVDSNVLLQLLEGIVGPLSQAIKSTGM